MNTAQKKQDAVASGRKRGILETWEQDDCYWQQTDGCSVEQQATKLQSFRTTSSCEEQEVLSLETAQPSLEPIPSFTSNYWEPRLLPLETTLPSSLLPIPSFTTTKHRDKGAPRPDRIESTWTSSSAQSVVGKNPKKKQDLDATSRQQLGSFHSNRSFRTISLSSESASRT
eukprot:scaffold10270_cov125-Cylindrotheca_fusiformis.AAC.1